MISLSVNASNARQSVLDRARFSGLRLAFMVLASFARRCPSGRDDAGCGLVRRGVDHVQQAAIHHPEDNPSSLAVVAPVIDPFDGIVILEDLLRIDEVDAMFGEIGGRLLCVPFEPIGPTTVNPYLSIEQGFNTGARSDKPGRMCNHEPKR
jgi:hypothetical protein